MTITAPILIKKKEQFDDIYLNLHQSIRAHSTHVGIVTGVMARLCKERLLNEYNLPKGKLEITIIRGGDYHDIGLHFISYVLCQKTGPLSETETAAVRQHPGYTVRLLCEYENVLFESEGAKQIALDMGRYHHEHHDGSGYPKGLKGDEIPFVSQLCSLADTLDKVAGDRRRNSFNSAVEIISENKGIRFSPEAVDCFLQSQNEIRKLYIGKNSWIKASAKEARNGQTED